MKLALALTITLSAAVAAFAQTPVDYLRDIKPILKARCYACHGALKQEAGLRLDTGRVIRQGGDSGAAVTPGQADESLLLEKVSAKDASQRMPAEGEPLTAAQVEALRSWISQGATSPDNEQPEPDPRQHWAFQQPKRPAVPVNGESDRKRNPVDAFLEDEFTRHGLSPQSAAPQHLLLRRVYLDLIGLPPTREELQAFLADDSPTAYEVVVDRLLNDSRYGERWARHWMDIWRYSDWYGRRHVPDVWNSAPQIWRWRDWIVRSLNEDHGYDRMLREMLAADEICPEDDAAVVATGYLIRNWYALNPNDWMRNTVEHAGKAFLGLTFNCAHCHDHKYDPISQEDYFRLRAFFEPIDVRQDRVPGEADPGPFQEYSYSTLRKIQRLGAVRIYDKTPDAPTWFYSGGDERNRVKERGSIPPGVPAFLGEMTPPITPINLPPRAWNPGLRPKLLESLLAEARAATTTAETDFAVARQSQPQVPQVVRDQLALAETEFSAAVREAEQAGKAGALVGRQSVLFDATTGRRVLQNGLQQLKRLDDGTTFSFQWLILNDAHVNFQFAKDVVKGLTAGYVAFEKGRIMSYQPGSFTEFEAGRYDFPAGQQRFQVRLVVETKADRCLLTVRSLIDDKLLVDAVPVALNAWNPIGDSTKAISIDARTGSVVLLDEVTVSGPSGENQLAARLLTFDFEPPKYTEGRDIPGIDGWANSTFGVAPATSVVSTTAGNSTLRDLSQKVQAARRALDVETHPLRMAEAQLIATRAELASLETRIAAELAKYEQPARESSDLVALARTASQLERDASWKRAEANVLLHERMLARAEAKSTKDASRPTELATAHKLLSASRPALEKARAAKDQPSESYSSFGPTYPKTSTGRRKALAEWIANRDNPLTARVAVNHTWARHFHAPLVASVTDFGRNGARPTHPELLDWLAVELMENGWSMKHLHRLIVTSVAYRRKSSITSPLPLGEGGRRPGEGSAAVDVRSVDTPPNEFGVPHPDPLPKGEVIAAFAHNVKHDPENKLLWRMNPGRMESEVVRDSLLYIAGKLDSKMGGQELENSEALTTFRRTLYYSVYPEQGGKSSLGELFDAPDALECYRRTRSIIPQQALALTNSDLIHRVSTDIASSITEPTADGFITAAFERILSRMPTASEITTCSQFLTEPANPRQRDRLVRALLNHNDFVTIR